MLKSCQYMLTDLRPEGVVIIMRYFELCLRAAPQLSCELFEAFDLTSNDVSIISPTLFVNLKWALQSLVSDVALNVVKTFNSIYVTTYYYFIPDMFAICNVKDMRNHVKPLLYMPVLFLEFYCVLRTLLVRSVQYTVKLKM